MLEKLFVNNKSTTLIHIPSLYSEQRTLYSEQRTLYSVPRTMYSVHQVRTGSSADTGYPKRIFY